jgi:hypothetical protein
VLVAHPGVGQVQPLSAVVLNDDLLNAAELVAVPRRKLRELNGLRRRILVRRRGGIAFQAAALCEARASAAVERCARRSHRPASRIDALAAGANVPDAKRARR